MARRIPTERARTILQRLVELNRVGSGLEPGGMLDSEDDGEIGLALTPVRRRRLYEGVVNQLQALISSGRLEPGDQLPSERALADQLAVSRTSVREGLRILEARGMLEARPGQGLFVRGRRTEEIVGILAAYLVRERESFLEVLDLREALERKAAERAALLATNWRPSRPRWWPCRRRSSRAGRHWTPTPSSTGPLGRLPATRF